MIRYFQIMLLSLFRGTNAGVYESKHLEDDLENKMITDNQQKQEYPHVMQMGYLLDANSWVPDMRQDAINFDETAAYYVALFKSTLYDNATGEVYK